MTSPNWERENGKDEMETREQRLAGIRERAEVELEKWVNTPEGGKIVMIAFGDSKTPMLAFAAAFADSERERVLLEAAKAQCPNCRNEIDLELAIFIDGKWKHKVRNGHGVGSFSCDSAAIHDLRSRGEIR